MLSLIESVSDSVTWWSVEFVIGISDSELASKLGLWAKISEICCSVNAVLYIITSEISPENLLDVESRREFTYAPITISDSEFATSAAVDTSSPSDITNVSGSVAVPSNVPLMYSDKLVLLTIAARWDQFSICVVPAISVHNVPSKTENLDTCSGEMMLFTDKSNDFSLDMIVYFIEP